MSHVYDHRQGTIFDRLAPHVPECGDRASVEFAAFGVTDARGGRAARRYLTLGRVSRRLISVHLFGNQIAHVTPDDVSLWTCGYGSKMTTRAALRILSPIGCHSVRRKVYAGAEPFREGMRISYTGQVLDPGAGPHVDGAPARRTRDEMGALR